MEELNKIDKKVQLTGANINKDNKPFLGILFTQDKSEYFVPLSSPKAKHQHMSNARDFHKILDLKTNELLSVVNFNNMIPVVPQLYNRINFSTDKDCNLLRKEYAFCVKNETTLKNKAHSYYKRYINGTLTEKERERTCDFTALENRMKSYIVEINSSSNVPSGQAPSADGAANAKSQASTKTFSSSLQNMMAQMPPSPKAQTSANQSVRKKDNVME